MRRLIRSPIALAFGIAAGLTALFPLADSVFAQTPPPPQVTVAFGAATGIPGSLGAAVFGVTVSGTPAVPVLVTTLLNSNPEPNPGYSFTPQVSALTFSNNGTSGLVASNSTLGHLYKLPGPSYSTSSSLYNAGGECGIFATGLGVDAGGNILGAGNYGCDGPSVFVYLSSDGIYAQRMDSVRNDEGLAGYNTIQTIVDATVSPGTFPNGIKAGDQIVLVGDVYSVPGQAVVFVYPQTAIKPSISSGLPVTGATAIVDQAHFPIGTGSAPVSIAISPIDGSLLVAVSDGTIYMIPATATGYGPPQTYAYTGQTWGKIGAGQQNGSLFVYATVAFPNNQVEAGSFEVFSGPVPTEPGYYTAPSAGVSFTGTQPTSVAVAQYKTGTTLASNCFSTCDVLGDGVLKTLIRGNTAGIPAGATITDQECVVLADPRGPHCGAGSPGGAQTLPLKQVCPGLSDSRIIPSYLCTDHSNPGFIVIASTAEQLDDTTGIEVLTAFRTTPELGYDAGCPADRVAFQSNDHSSVETQFPEGVYLFEFENSCTPDPANAAGPHRSIFAAGFQTGPADLTQFARPGKSGAVGFVDFKFNNLQQTIKNSNIRYGWERLVLQFAVAEAKYLVDVGHYDCAAEIMVRVDRFVRRHVGDFLHSAPGAAVREPNPAFDIIMRVSNAFFSIETGIENKPPYPSWPLSGDPHLCQTHECDVPGMDR